MEIKLIISTCLQEPDAFVLDTPEKCQAFTERDREAIGAKLEANRCARNKSIVAARLHRLD